MHVAIFEETKFDRQNDDERAAQERENNCEEENDLKTVKEGKEERVEEIKSPEEKKEQQETEIVARQVLMKAFCGHN